MHDHRIIVDHFLKLEDMLLAQATLKEAVVKSRVIAQAPFSFESDSLRFSVTLKEVQSKPRFFTVKFMSPIMESFIFTSFDRTGNRQFNKYVFMEMMGFLAGSNLIQEFEKVLRERVEAGRQRTTASSGPAA